MSEQKYKNREIDNMLKDLKDWMNLRFQEISGRFDEIDKREDRIEKHAEKTNGRVTKLELWRAGVAGGFAVSLIFGGWFVYSTLDNLDNRVKDVVEEQMSEALQDYFSNYDISIE